mgnify:FL=1
MPASELKTNEKFAASGRGGQAREQLPYQITEAGSSNKLDSGETAENGGTVETRDTRIKGLDLKMKDE